MGGGGDMDESRPTGKSTGGRPRSFTGDLPDYVSLDDAAVAADGGSIVLDDAAATADRDYISLDDAAVTADSRYVSLDEARYHNDYTHNDAYDPGACGPGASRAGAVYALSPGGTAGLRAQCVP